MTKNKRFMIDEFDMIVDNLKEEVYNPFMSIKEVYKVCEKLNKLNDENMKLEQSKARILRELLIYRRIADCNNCAYQNYDWFEDGDEFEVCEKGNTNQQIEYHICKEWREI